MSMGMVLSSREQRMVQDLTNALGVSLDLHAVLNEAYGLILRLVGADYGALAVTRSERADEYEWIVQNLPPSFLGSYEEMGPHDFVRSSVLANINVVMRDAEMLDRRTFERNMMYHRARDVGAPIEQVMAVMLHAGGGFQSGLSLYRDRRRPFTERDQRLLQQLTPAIANAVRNCRSFAKVERGSTLLDVLLGSEHRAVVVVQAPARELYRTASASALLDAWFTPVELGVGSLPRVLVDELSKARAVMSRGRVVSSFWQKEGTEADLRVEFRPLSEPVGEPAWALMFREVSVRADWAALLTKRERAVTLGIIREWDTPLIAQVLGCEPTTVKKHVQHILDKLGLPNCKTLRSRALPDA